MRIGRIKAATAALALAGLVLTALTGCQSSPESATPGSLRGPCCDRISGIPSDLPEAPDPCKKYCRVWVPATYRKVPTLVKCKPSCTRTVEVPVKVMTAREEVVRPRCWNTAQTCGNDCEDTLVQVKPGGYRWEQSEAGCWQYCYRKPEYKWCQKNVREDDITYCVETPPEYRTVVTTEDAVRLRQEYVPPEYEVRMVDQLYTPGHWEWREAPGCGATAPDNRCWTKPQVTETHCTDCRPKPAALDCGCPATN